MFLIDIRMCKIRITRMTSRDNLFKKIGNLEKARILLKKLKKNGNILQKYKSNLNLVHQSTKWKGKDLLAFIKVYSQELLQIL